MLPYEAPTPLLAAAVPKPATNVTPYQQPAILQRAAGGTQVNDWIKGVKRGATSSFGNIDDDIRCSPSYRMGLIVHACSSAHARTLCCACRW